MSSSAIPTESELQDLVFEIDTSVFNVTSNDETITDEDIRWVAAVAELDRSETAVTASKLRDLLDVDATGSSSYRLDKLEQWGLITSSYADLSAGPHDDRVVELTDHGRSVVDDLSVRDGVVVQNEREVGQQLQEQVEIHETALYFLMGQMVHNFRRIERADTPASIEWLADDEAAELGRESLQLSSPE